jgi:hypothetical protein
MTGELEARRPHGLAKGKGPRIRTFRTHRFLSRRLIILTDKRGVFHLSERDVDRNDGGRANGLQQKRIN